MVDARPVPFSSPVPVRQVRGYSATTPVTAGRFSRIAGGCFPGSHKWCSDCLNSAAIVPVLPTCPGVTLTGPLCPAGVPGFFFGPERLRALCLPTTPGGKRRGTCCWGRHQEDAACLRRAAHPRCRSCIRMERRMAENSRSACSRSFAAVTYGSAAACPVRARPPLLRGQALAMRRGAPPLTATRTSQFPQRRILIRCAFSDVGPPALPGRLVP